MISPATVISSRLVLGGRQLTAEKAHRTFSKLHLQTFNQRRGLLNYFLSASLLWVQDRFFFFLIEKFTATRFCTLALIWLMICTGKVQLEVNVKGQIYKHIRNVICTVHTWAWTPHVDLTCMMTEHASVDGLLKEELKFLQGSARLWQQMMSALIGTSVA